MRRHQMRSHSAYLIGRIIGKAAGLQPQSEQPRCCDKTGTGACVQQGSQRDRVQRNRHDKRIFNRHGHRQSSVVAAPWKEAAAAVVHLPECQAPPRHVDIQIEH